MTNRVLEKKMAIETNKFQTAMRINELLAEAVKQAGIKCPVEADEYRQGILELVTEEDES